MSRYNSNYGSHDQLQDLRKLNMEVMREVDRLKAQAQELEQEVERLTDELYLAHEALRREMPDMQTKTLDWTHE
jgi:cell division protein FtsB